MRGLLRLKPAHLLDFLQHFVVFETKKGTTTKKIARYQQFEAVNELVDRTVSLAGKPVQAQDRTGLIWHTQGSGKSLTMIFAGQKLRRHPALDNPTVLIVVDRRDLKTQLSDDFDACDYPNVEKALGVEDLKRKLRADWRGTLVTTIQAFQNMGDLAPLTRDNIISMVDECHRSQKGEGTESFAMTMRVKLANGFRYGFTGTPIDRTMQNTHRDFGPLKDGEQERYLSYYGIRRAIRDGATLEVHYIRDKVPFEVDEAALNVGFEQMCAEMELEDEEAKDLIQRQRAQWKELARHPDRVEIVRRTDAHALPRAPRPERLQGPARRRRPQGLRALQAGPRRQARRARPSARVVGRDHLRRPEQRARDRALRVREGEAGRADRLLQADARRSGRRGTASGTAITAASGGRRSRS